MWGYLPSQSTFLRVPRVPRVPDAQNYLLFSMCPSLRCYWVQIPLLVLFSLLDTISLSSARTHSVELSPYYSPLPS